MDILKENFYHMNGEICDNYGILGNCVSRNVFFILRHKLYELGMKNPEKYLYKLYLQSWNIKMNIEKLGGELHFSIDDNLYWEEIISDVKEEIFNWNSELAIQYISSFLSRGEPILITANARDIIFHLSSHLDRNEKENENRKIRFLLIKEEQDYFYFVYTYSLCNKNKYIHCEENESVGILSKHHFATMFQKYVSVTSISCDRNNMIDENKCLVNVFEQIKQEIQHEKKNELLFGVDCIDFIKNLIKGNDLLFSTAYDDNLSPSKYTIDCENIRLCIIWSINRKKHMIQLAKSLEIAKSDFINQYMNLLYSSIDKWYQLNDRIKYIFFKGNSALKKDIVILDELITIERKLNEFYNYNEEILVQKYLV